MRSDQVVAFDTRVPKVLGIVLILCAIVMIVMPREIMTGSFVFAGCLFILIAIVDFWRIRSDRDSCASIGENAGYPIVDFALGVLFILFPFFFASLLPWLIGVLLIVYGLVGAKRALDAKNAGVPKWIGPLIGAVLVVVAGILFFVSPQIFVVILAIFIGIRGLSLLVYANSSLIFVRVQG